MTKNTQGSEWEKKFQNADRDPGTAYELGRHDERLALLQKVREMLEDEDDNIYDQWGKVGVSSHKVERNKLRAEIRTELAKLEGEI